MLYKECFKGFKEQEWCNHNYFYNLHKDEDCVMLLWEHRALRFAMLKIGDGYATMAIYPRSMDHEPLYTTTVKADIELWNSPFSKRIYKSIKLWKEYYGKLVLKAI